MSFSPLLLSVLLGTAISPQASFTRFTYCREMPRGVYEKQCVTLTPEGTGQSQMKRRGSNQVDSPLTLSPSGREKMLAIIAATNNLENAKDYETKRKVADLGRKRLTLEMPSGTREADFNYSDFKEVNALAVFFDGLLNQQTFVFDLENAVRYERLSVPERLDQLDKEIAGGRVGDPAALAPLLERIVQDDRIMNYARENAQRMRGRVLTAK
jgi:hypothetical protein